jgi:hypothetical protein
MANDAKIFASITEILWKENLDKNDEQSLLKAIAYPHDEIAAYALTVSVVKLHNLDEIIEIALKSKKNYTAYSMAQYFKNLQDKDGLLVVQVAKGLEGKKFIRYSVPQAEDYYRDIVIFSTILNARKNKTKAMLPPNIDFSSSQKALIDYAYMPADVAFDFIFRSLNSPDVPKYRKSQLVRALSYSPLFFDKAINQYNSAEISEQTKIYLFRYLEINQSRFDSEQEEIFRNIQKKN